MSDLHSQMAALNAKFEALMAVLEPQIPKQRKPRGTRANVVLLSCAEAAHHQIATQKPHLARPTWTYLGKDVTCVWPLLDVICGPKRQDIKKKAVAYVREHGLGWMTVGHKAHSDQGPIPVPKYGPEEALYLPVPDALRAVEKAAPRIGTRLVQQFRMRCPPPTAKPA